MIAKEIASGMAIFAALGRGFNALPSREVEYMSDV
jgi:hypothetical protein